MWETPDELSSLQGLLDRSFERASEHLKSIMTDERRLSADRLVAEIPSPAVLNIASVTARGEPRVSAVDGHFLHGRWHWTTATDSPRSPSVAVTTMPRPNRTPFHQASWKVRVRNSTPATEQNSTEPAKPSQVLALETIGAMGCLPNNTPVA